MADLRCVLSRVLVSWAPGLAQDFWSASAKACEAEDLSARLAWVARRGGAASGATAAPLPELPGGESRGSSICTVSPIMLLLGLLVGSQAGRRRCVAWFLAVSAYICKRIDSEISSQNVVFGPRCLPVLVPECKLDTESLFVEGAHRSMPDKRSLHEVPFPSECAWRVRAASGIVQHAMWCRRPLDVSGEARGGRGMGRRVVLLRSRSGRRKNMHALRMDGWELRLGSAAILAQGSGSAAYSALVGRLILGTCVRPRWPESSLQTLSVVRRRAAVEGLPSSRPFRAPRRL